MIDTLNKDINKEIFSAVRRATIHISSKLKMENSDTIEGMAVDGPKSHSMSVSVTKGGGKFTEILSNKADKDVVEQAFEMKTNK